MTGLYLPSQEWKQRLPAAVVKCIADNTDGSEDGLKRFIDDGKTLAHMSAKEVAAHTVFAFARLQPGAVPRLTRAMTSGDQGEPTLFTRLRTVFGFRSVEALAPSTELLTTITRYSTASAAARAAPHLDEWTKTVLGPHMVLGELEHVVAQRVWAIGDVDGHAESADEQSYTQLFMVPI